MIDYLLSGKSIKANDDLNDIQTVGVYSCAGNTTAETLTNCPTRYAFVMFCTSTTKDLFIAPGRWIIMHQIIIDYYSNIYIRYMSYEGGSSLVAQQWKKITTTAA